MKTGIFGKAFSDLRHETLRLPEDIFAETITAERLAELLGVAVEKARDVFLRGEDPGDFLDLRAAGIFSRGNEGKALLLPVEGPGYFVPLDPGDAPPPPERTLLDQALDETRNALASPEGRTAALPVFEAAAEDFRALVPAFIRLYHAAVPPSAVARGFLRVPLVAAPECERRDPREFALEVFITASCPLGIDGKPASPSALDEDAIKGTLVEKLPEEAAASAAKKIRRKLLEAVESWPRPEDVASLFSTAEEWRDPKERGEPWAGVGVVVFIFQTSANLVLERHLSRLSAGLVLAEGIEWALRREARHVAIPSEASIPVLFTAGVPLAQRLTRFGVARVADEDGNLDGVTFELKTLKDDSSRELTLFDPDVFEDIPRTELSREAWRSEALALLPKVLGPEKLALYYATWKGVDAAGRFPFHPLPFLELFGMDPDDSRSRKKIEAEIRVLSRIQLKIKRKYGPGAGTLASAESTFRLIEESSERLDLRFRDHPRLQRIVYFQHPQAMLDIQRQFHVRLPREAFQLVGKWRPGRGSKDDGIRALALVTTAHVLARTYAGRSGKQAGATYFGSDGFEIPVEEIVLASGFTTAEKFAHDSKRVTDRLSEAVARLALEFRFLGPGSEVKDGRFRFEPTDALRKDLLPIAEKAQITPKRPSPAIEVPPRKKSRRGRRGV